MSNSFRYLSSKIARLEEKVSNLEQAVRGFDTPELVWQNLAELTTQYRFLRILKDHALENEQKTDVKEILDSTNRLIEKMTNRVFNGFGSAFNLIEQARNDAEMEGHREAVKWLKDFAASLLD